ncbi:MAG: 4-hydroxy-tetrahydrodipicolinate reductase [Pseudomonadota bacterium]
MTNPTRVAISGADGRMGRTLLELSAATAGIEVGAALEQPGSSALGRDVGQLIGAAESGVAVTADLKRVANDFDVLIDFTVPEATLVNLERCRALGKAMVIGTTGLGDAVGQIDKAARDIPIVFAPNMSVGVNLLFCLVALAARTLGDDFDVEIIEAHHRHKIDAPSGTAVRIGEIVAEELDRDLKRDAVYGRQGRTGARERKTIGFETIRAGEIVGDHTAMFAGAGERLELTHRAGSRATFASGALRAARWVVAQPHGRFDMLDVLDLTLGRD